MDSVAGYVMRPRYLPPVRSPLGLPALLSGFGAMVRGGRAARHEVEGWIRSVHSPEQFLLTDSGTSALALALRVAAAVGRTPVALPGYSCYDVATAADAAGVPFLLYDLDPHTLAPEPASLAEAVRAGAKSVVVAYLYGVPVDLDGVRSVVGPDVLLIEDAAQGAGISRRGRPAGALGQMGVLSFGRGKGTTGGRGGALLVNDAALDQAFRQVVSGVGDGRRGTILDYGKLKAQWLFGRPWLYALPAHLPFLGLGETVYRPAEAPTGISALAAGTLSRTISLARAEAEVRRRNAAEYAATLAGIDGLEVLPQVMPAAWTPGYLRFPVLRGAGRVMDLRGLRPLGVERGYPTTLAALPEFGVRRLNREHALPGAERLAAKLVTLPTHSFVTREDVDRLVLALAGPG